MTVYLIPLYLDDPIAAGIATCFLVISVFYLYRVVKAPRSLPLYRIPYQHAYFFCFGYAWIYLLPFIRRPLYRFSGDRNSMADFDAFRHRIDIYDTLFPVLGAFFYSMAYVAYFCLIAVLLHAYGHRQYVLVNETTQKGPSSEQPPMLVEGVTGQDTAATGTNTPNSPFFPKSNQFRVWITFGLSKVPWFMTLVPVFMLISTLVRKPYEIELLIDIYILLWTVVFTFVTGLYLFQASSVKGVHVLSTLLFSILLQLVIAISQMVSSVGMNYGLDFDPIQFVPWLAMVSILVFSLDLQGMILTLQEKKTDLETELETVPVGTVEQQEQEQEQEQAQAQAAGVI